MQDVYVSRTDGAQAPTAVMLAFIGDHRGAHRVELVCAVLPVARSTYCTETTKNDTDTSDDGHGRGSGF